MTILPDRLGGPKLLCMITAQPIRDIIPPCLSSSGKLDLGAGCVLALSSSTEVCWNAMATQSFDGGPAAMWSGR